MIYLFKLDYDTKYICLILEFEYDSKLKKVKFRSNDIREAFLGISPPEYPNGRGNPNVPRKIKEKMQYDREIILPIHFSLIKKPVKVDLPTKKNYTIRNTAVGTIILYKYLGLIENYQNCCKAIEELIDEKKKVGKPIHMAEIQDYKIIVGYDLEDVTE